jgi:hypothetical protein
VSSKEPEELPSEVATEKSLAQLNNRPKSEVDASWNFLGLRVDRKTEIIALSAFALSISGILWQVANFARGAVVRLFPSDQIVIASTNALGRSYSGSENLLALIATMSYVNEGDVGHNAVVRKERIEFLIGGDRKAEHQWYEFVSSDVKDEKLEIKKEGDARPFSVNAGSATSHETLFAAWEIFCNTGQSSCVPTANFVIWSDFLGAIKTNSSMPITAIADIYSAKSLNASCEIRLRAWEIEVLEKEQFISVACFEVHGNQRTNIRPAISKPPPSKAK